MTQPINRRRVLAGIAVAVVFAGPAFAATITDQIVAQLKSQGFSGFTIGRTLLGRIRIVATNSAYRREIIIDRRTGEILRDLTTTLGGEPVAGQISGGGSPNSGSGGGGSGSGGNSGPGGGNDDDDDDEDDDDHSGHGGGGDDDDDDDHSGHGGGDDD